MGRHVGHSVQLLAEEVVPVTRRAGSVGPRMLMVFVYGGTSVCTNASEAWVGWYSCGWRVLDKCSADDVLIYWHLSG